MSFTSRLCRICWNRLARVKITQRPVSKVAINLLTPRNTYSPATPCVLGFSLYTLLGFEKKNSEEDELINTIKHCVLFIQRNEFEKAEQLLHVALRQAQQIQHQLAITYIYDVMANLALEREQLDKAKKLFVSVSQRLMADGAKEDDLRLIHMSIKLARISHLRKEYSVAQVGYDWCLNKLHGLLKSGVNNDAEVLLAMAEDWYGRLLIDCNQAENGIKYMENALDRMKTQDVVEKEHIVQQMSDIGAFYCNVLDKVDLSIALLKEAIEVGKTLPGYEELGVVYVNLGRAFIKKNLLNDARKSCGYAWRLGNESEQNIIKAEAELCLKEINNMK